MYVVRIPISRDLVYVSYTPADVMCVHVQIKKPVHSYVGLRVLCSDICK